MDESSLDTGVTLEQERNTNELGTDSDVLVEKKILYHGSATPGIGKLDVAEEDTVGSGVYFTSDEKSAVGYANRRTRNRGGKPVVYKAEVENLRLANLTTDENVKKVLEGYKLVLQQKMKDTDKWFSEQALRESIEVIDKGEVGAGTVRKATFSNTKSFTEYLSSLGYDGLIALEGGEGEEIGNHDTYVVFNPDKVKIIQEQKVVK